MDNKKETKYNWLEFAQSFLMIAKLACQELEDTRDDKHNRTTRFDPPQLILPYTHFDLFISIVFNIKHGLEVFIKTLSIISVGKPERTHDIQDLFKELKDVLPKEIKPVKDERGNKIEEKDIDKIPSNLDALEKLVLKYYHCEFLNSDKKIVDIYDELNDVFRYPDNKAKVKIDLVMLDKSIIAEIHEDVDKIYRLFNDLGYIIDIYKKCKKKDI